MRDDENEPAVPLTNTPIEGEIKKKKGKAKTKGKAKAKAKGKTKAAAADKKAKAPKKPAATPNGPLEAIVGNRLNTAKARVVQHLMAHAKKQLAIGAIGKIAYPEEKEQSGTKLNMLLKGIDATLKEKKSKFALKSEGKGEERTIGLYPL